MLKEDLDKMIQEGQIPPSHSPVGSSIFFITKGNWKGQQLCNDCWPHNKYTVLHKIPLSIMRKLQGRVCRANYITKINFKAALHWIWKVLGHEKIAMSRTKFGLYEYIVIPIGLTNAAMTFPREIYCILKPLLGLELFINTTIQPDEDKGMVVVAYINDIDIMTHGSLQTHHPQLGHVFYLVQKNGMGLEIDKCIFDTTDAPCIGCIVSGKILRMDPAKAQDIVDWPTPTNQHEIQLPLGLWNFYRRVKPNYAWIVAPITDWLLGDRQSFYFGNTEHTAFLNKTILFTTGTTPTLRHFDNYQPAMIDTDALDVAIATMWSQNFGDITIHACSFICRKPSRAKYNYNVYDKEVLATVEALTKGRHVVQ